MQIKIVLTIIYMNNKIYKYSEIFDFNILNTFI